MTQPPLPPQMPPPEPLDEAERVLARALRSLPVGAPPPELDARILGAARRAVHLAQPRKRDRRWLVGFGTAASALLALGLFVKTHTPGQDAVYTPPAETESAAPASVPANTAAPAAMKDQVEPQAATDAVAPAGNMDSAQSAGPIQSAAPMNAAPVEAVPPKQMPGRAGLVIGSLSAAKSAPQAFPSVNGPPPPPTPIPPRMQSTPAPMSPVVMEDTAPMSVPPAPPAPPPPAQAVDQRQEHKVDQGYAARRDAAAAASIATPASPVAAGGAARDQPALGKTASNALKSTVAESDMAASGAARAADAQKDKSLDRVEVTGNRIRRAKDEGAMLPSVDDDAKLSPTQWIQRIRARVKAADGDGARESLRRFRLRYPGADIPDDLIPLLH